jgi:hypothetical protein
MELQKYGSLLGAGKITESQAIDTSYDHAEASPATALVEDEQGNGPPVAGDEPELSRNQALERTQDPPLHIPSGMASSTAEKWPVGGDGKLVDQRATCLNDAADRFEKLSPDAAQAIDGGTDHAPIDIELINQRLHGTLSPAGRPNLPPRLDLRPPRHKALR